MDAENVRKTAKRIGLRLAEGCESITANGESSPAIWLAGSLRRKCADVSDIDIVLVPRLDDAVMGQDLFGEKTAKVPAIDPIIEQLLAEGVITRPERRCEG